MCLINCLNPYTLQSFFHRLNQTWLGYKNKFREEFQAIGDAVDDK